MKKFLLCLMLILVQVLSLLMLLSFLNIKINHTDFILLYLFIQFVYGHYHITSNLIWKEIKQLNVSHFSFFIICCLTLSTLNTNLFFKLLLITIIMYCISIITNRTLRIILRKLVARRTLVIGTGADACRLGEITGNNRFALTVVKGFVRVGEEPISKYFHDLTGTYDIYELNDLERVIDELQIEQVIVALTDRSSMSFDDVMVMLKDKVKYIKYLPILNIPFNFDSKIEDFDGLLLISTAKYRIGWIQKLFKRIIDICASLAGIALLLPLTLLIKFKNKKNNDNGPIFFTQERIGKNGKPIKIYKYRSMIENAETVLEELMESDSNIKEEYLANKKLENDPRITDIGSFLRKTSLDEFPQFINVLKGEMSLVGPRPFLPREKSDMGIYYDSIVKCKPGITGMWQANGRSDVGFIDRCRLDDYYYRNWTISLDFIILYKTAKSVFYGKGAL